MVLPNVARNCLSIGSPARHILAVCRWQRIDRWRCRGVSHTPQIFMGFSQLLQATTVCPVLSGWRRTCIWLGVAHNRRNKDMSVCICSVIVLCDLHLATCQDAPCPWSQPHFAATYVTHTGEWIVWELATLACACVRPQMFCSLQWVLLGVYESGYIPLSCHWRYPHRTVAWEVDEFEWQEDCQLHKTTHFSGVGFVEALRFILTLVPYWMFYWPYITVYQYSDRTSQYISLVTVHHSISV
jgi:hypothetical protein